MHYSYVKITWLIKVQSGKKVNNNKKNVYPMCLISFSNE